LPSSWGLWPTTIQPPTARRRRFSLSDPCSAWTAKANKRGQFGYGLNYLIDIENAVIADARLSVPSPKLT